MAPQTARPVEVFISYSHKDDELRAQLEASLAMLRRRGVVRQWSDRRINPGQEWDKQIDRHLESADIILLLVSPDFLASDYCYDIEVTRAMQRHEAGAARVIPVILRYCDDWQSAPFGKLQALPKDAVPIKDWPDRDKAFADVAAGIRRAVEELLLAPEEPDEVHDGTKDASPPSPIPRPPVIGFVSRRDAQGRGVGMAFPHIGMRFPLKRMLFPRLGMPFRAVGMLFRRVGMLFRAVGMLFRGVGMAFRSVGMAFRSVGMACAGAGGGFGACKNYCCKGRGR